MGESTVIQDRHEILSGSVLGATPFKSGFTLKVLVKDYPICSNKITTKNQGNAQNTPSYCFTQLRCEPGTQGKIVNPN